ncbi:MAG: hypothetical protein HY275_05460 [Gemmatimonadetes bacterium]|nr:hypothetical protein [Gemmatimonadota bacterium]
MKHDHELDDARLRALLRATDDATPLDSARADALAARIVAQGAGWLALQAEGAATRPDDAALDQLAQRIAFRARPTLARHARTRRTRAPWLEVAVRWSRPAVPIALAAGIGAMVILLRTPRTTDVADATVEAVSDSTSAYAAVGGTARLTLAAMTPESAVNGGGAEVTP